MAFVCKLCDPTHFYKLKTNLERHECSSRHLANHASAQPKITDYFKKIEEIETKVVSNTESILDLTSRVQVLEALTTLLTSEVTALAQANTRLLHETEMAALKHAHALEIMQLKLDAKPAHAPRRTGEENVNIRIEKLFQHDRKYRKEDTKSGFSDLCDKIQKVFIEKPDTDKGDLEERLFDIFKTEVYKKPTDMTCFSGACMALEGLNRYLAFSQENFKWLRFLCSEESGETMKRSGFTGA